MDDVQKALKRGPLSTTAIDAIQSDGAIVLIGRAKSFYLKQLAQEYVKQIAKRGNLRIENRIVVGK